MEKFSIGSAVFFTVIAVILFISLIASIITESPIASAIISPVFCLICFGIGYEVVQSNKNEKTKENT